MLSTATLLLAASCSNKSDKAAATDSTDTEKQECIQSGDLLFVSLPEDYSIGFDSAAAAQCMEHTQGPKNIIHVAMLEIAGDTTFIIDATLKHGVGRYPIDSFLCDFRLPNGGLPVLEVYRLKDNGHAAEFIDNAKQFVGRKYDVDFDLENEPQYCSELVRNAYIIDGIPLFDTSAIDFRLKKDGEMSMPKYWEELFGYIGKEIPQGKAGVLPCDLLENGLLEKTDIVIGR